METDAKTSQFPLAARTPEREEARPGLALPGSQWAPLRDAEMDLKPQAWGPWPPAPPGMPGGAALTGPPMLALVLQLNWQLPEGRDFSHLNPEHAWQRGVLGSPQGQQEVELSLALHTEVNFTSAPSPELLSVAPAAGRLGTILPLILCWESLKGLSKDAQISPPQSFPL